MLVCLSRDHVGKPDKLKDTGASADLDHNGKVSVAEQEAILTAQYILAAEIRMRELGHDVIVISDGRYSDRHTRVNGYAKVYPGKVAYVACHLNAGGGAYGSCFFDERSKAGPLLATAVANKLRAAFSELASVKVFGAAPGGTWANAYATISGVYDGRAVGVCFEPCFMDGPHATELLSTNGLTRIGGALADGLHSWLTS